jgi:hypothetical protein
MFTSQIILQKTSATRPESAISRDAEHRITANE